MARRAYTPEQRAAASARQKALWTPEYRAAMAARREVRRLREQEMAEVWRRRDEEREGRFAEELRELDDLHRQADALGLTAAEWKVLLERLLRSVEFFAPDEDPGPMRTGADRVLRRLLLAEDDLFRSALNKLNDLRARYAP